MSDMTFWEATMGPMDIIIGVLPLELQKKIVERLQDLAVVQADRGDMVASYFSRALSGEPYPEEPTKPAPRFTVIQGGAA
jgi:hypothetical protein